LSQFGPSQAKEVGKMSAKHPDGNKNVVYIIRSLDKTTNPREKPTKEKKRPFAAAI
ncbi:22172_t:CDS:2, partial [Gigaspora rosea]